jgi:adenylate cyclase
MLDHARRAYEAAQAMLREVALFNEELAAGGKPPIAIGIGLDTGEVVVGSVGSDKRLEFTLIGVPVNNSAYLSKVRPPKALLSETTKQALPNGIGVMDYDRILLKGASEPQAIFQLEIEVTAAES